jgi:hypothetical protein
LGGTARDASGHAYFERRAWRAAAPEEVAEMSSIVLEDKIAAFLMKKRELSFCDECISRELSAPIDDVRRETQTMKSRPGFVRANTNCVQCGCHKRAIRAI